MYSKICKHCAKPFSSINKNTRYCSIECKKEVNKIYIKQYNSRQLPRELKGIEDIDYVICKLCNKKMAAIQGRHLTCTHNINSKQYKEMFPDALMLPDLYNGGFKQHKGKHMKEEKYRKMFSEKISGQKNINSKVNATEKERKERSPFAKEFYEKRNIDQCTRINFINDVAQNRSYTTDLSYYINKGFSTEEAKILLKDRQTTFSLEKCIKKYGEIEGLNKWKERQEKWLKNYAFSNYSKISQKLFNRIYEKIKNSYKDIYFATKENNGKNNEYRLKLYNRIILPDFYIADNNKIIEFDGVYWHKKNPENKKRESDRDKSIILSGYSVLHIREDEYYKDPDGTIQKCVDFIYQK